MVVEIELHPDFEQALSAWQHRFPNTSQWDRTAPSNAPDQDAALLYVQHEFDEHRFLILAFLYPDAHGQARQERLMKYLGYEAQIFQDS